MPVFVWEGKTRTGEIKKGELEAPNDTVVTAQLRRLQIIPTKIKEKSKSFDFKLPGFGGKVPIKDVVIFTRQFATMIDAGLPLVQCLDILGSQSENLAFRKIIIKVKEDVESGSTFADALKKHPKVFDELYVNLVAAGEIGGILDTILNRLAGYMEKAEALKSKVKGAMVYPATVVGVAVIVVAVILIFVIPTFKTMFEGAGAALPAPTQFVISLSDFMKNNIIYILVGIGLIIFAIKKYYSTEGGMKLIDDLLLKIPVLGMLLRKVAVARFSRTLSTMISSGVPILDGLTIVAKTSGNKTIERALNETKQSISQGKTISEPLGKSKVFPGMVVQMVSVGEATGALDTMLSKIADFYDAEVDTAVDALTSLMEPLMMLVLGTVVGGLIVAMYLPIFKLAGTVGG